VGNGDIAPRILNLGSRWGWVVSFTTRPHYPRGKIRGGGSGHECRSVRGGGNQTPVFQPVAYPLYWLSYPGLQKYFLRMWTKQIWLGILANDKLNLWSLLRESLLSLLVGMAPTSHLASNTTRMWL